MRVKPGDVFEIPLPDGRFAYGRVYDDAGVAIYKVVFTESGSPPIGTREFLFHVGLYRDVLKSGEWPVVGKDPFVNGESSWPPPKFILDKIGGGYSIYHKGEIRPSSKEECSGLEEAAVWDSHHIIARILSLV